MVNLVSSLAFWKKRGAQKTSEPERIIPLPNLTGPSPDALDTLPTTPPETVDKARDTLKVLKLERQILGSAVTTIYESHSKGVISEAERNRMLEKYKVELKRLEKEIEDNQHIVDLHDVEVEREELIKGFKTKLAELDARLNSLKSGSPTQKPGEPSPGDLAGKENTDRSQRPDGNADPQEVTESEKRLEKIREEILKAMDRLEQIETEG